MTLPAPWKRTTAKERRRWRAEFRALKEQVAANPSPELLKQREMWTRHADRERAQAKVKRSLAGIGIRPFSPAEMARLKPDEIAVLRAEASNRLATLADQRAAFGRNSWLCVLSFTAEQLAAIASLPP